MGSTPGHLLKYFSLLVSLHYLGTRKTIPGKGTTFQKHLPNILPRLLPVVVVRLHVGDLHAVGWGEGP